MSLKATHGAKGRNRAEERFRLAFEAVPTAIVIVDQEGKIVLANSSAEKLFGYRREELVGRSVEILVPVPLRRHHAALRRNFFSQQAARTIPGRDLYAQRKDGNQFPVEIALCPIETEDGPCVVSSIVDLTDRKRVESSLRESEERFRNMADSAPVMICASGPDKLGTFFNKGWLSFTGRLMEQELGTGWTQSLHPDDVERAYASYSASFDERRQCHVEYRLRRADGEYRWILCSGGPRFGPDGVFAGYVGTCIDITEFKRTQEEALARQKFESLGVLTGGIAHDFNNLLGSILAEAELAQTNMAAGLVPVEEVRKIRAVAIRASEIVRELMIYAGKDKANLDLVDLSVLVEEMLELLKISISKHAILKTDLDRKLPPMRVNPAQIRQVVMNLILNASEALGERGGAITVRTSFVAAGRCVAANGTAKIPEGDHLRLEVSDTGPGMPEEVQARIFDPFFSTKLAGRGLGLAVVHAIVSAYGGVINLFSKPGEGTRFEVFLPCAAEGALEVRRAAVAAPAESAPRTTGAVLLVEDEDGLRIAVSKMLGKRGFSVIEACDGSVAIDVLRSKKSEIDVILLDMTIPGIPSREVIAEAQRIRPNVKVILTTAYSREMAARSFKAPQVKGFIRKPYQVGDLVHLLKDVLSA